MPVHLSRSILLSLHALELELNIYLFDKLCVHNRVPASNNGAFLAFST